MQQLSVIGIVAAGALCAALLWIGAESSTLARARGGAAARWGVAACAVLSAAALAVPWLAWSGERGPGVAETLLVLTSAWLLVGGVAVADSAWARERRARRAGAALGVAIAAGLHTLVALPGLLPPARGLQWAGGGLLGASFALLLGVLLAGALLAALGFGEPTARARALRLGAAVVAAATAWAGAVLSVAGPARVDGAAWLPLGALVALGAALLGILHATRGGALGPARPLRSAAVDALTGLPTRLHFEAELHRAAQRCLRQRTGLAVLFIDLDGFKPVNDHFGHSSGDRVLEQVGERLRGIARSGGVAARVGGDEFLFLATGIDTKDLVAQIAARLVEALERPYRIDDREVAISCSVGIALYPQKCQPDKLIARADAAMYAAKRAGGRRHCFYAPAMDADLQHNFDTVRDLRAALVRDELELFFQPKIDARSGQVTAAEALLRWNHPVRGVVAPNDFVPLAERSGLIGPLGNWVIEAACRQARDWRDKGLRMRVAINLSAYQMRQDELADRITESLARHQVHPSLLTCEITESAAMEDTAATQETFRRLGELGVHLSIDDFGTGYSSLSYLRRLPAEELKIDASFVRDVDHSADARAVIDAVVKLAHALGLKVVAEGVESRRQSDILVELGCDELQGYFFAKPMSAHALLLWAMADGSSGPAFRESLFVEHRSAAGSGSRGGTGRDQPDRVARRRTHSR